MRGSWLLIGLISFSVIDQGCKVSDTSTVIQIVRALTADANCTYSVNNASIYGGTYDMSGATSFHLAVEVRNLTEAETNDPSVGFGTNNVRPRTNDVLIDTYDVCWYRYEQPTPTSTAPGYVDCDQIAAALPAQYGQVNGGVTVERQSSAVSELELLNLDQLRAVYGSNFFPPAIPIRGSLANVLYSFGAEDGSNATTRSPAWGTYPTTLPMDKIIVQVRANGTMQGGLHVTSNWFRFAIDVCVRCIVRCPDLPITQCAADNCTLADSSVIACPNPCGGADICVNGQCADGSDCSGAQLCPDNNGTQALCLPVRYQFFAQYPVPTLSGICLPFQGGGAITCDVTDVCATPF